MHERIRYDAVLDLSLIMICTHEWSHDTSKGSEGSRMFGEMQLGIKQQQK